MIIDRGSGVPLWRQLYELLRDQIITGQLAPDSQLPAERDIGVYYNLGRDAVRQALRELRSERLITGQPGERYRVRTPIERTEVVVRRGDRAVIRMASPDEQRRLGVAAGEPVLEVQRPAGTQVVPALTAAVVVR